MYRDSNFLWLVFAAVVVGILEILALIEVRLPSPIEAPFFCLFILGIGYQTLWHGFLALLTLNFKSINALMLIAIGGAWYLGKYEEAAVVIVLYTLAEKLEEMGIDKSQSALNTLLESMPKLVKLKNQDNPIPVENAVIGDIILIKPGEMIPLDGRVAAGSSFVDESTINGEPIPQDKSVDDPVYAGTLNKMGFLEIEVLKTFYHTTFAKIKELTFQATQFKAPTQNFIEKFSQIYTPAVILLAFLSVFVPVIILGYPFTIWLPKAISLLVIACPCALVISTPISIYSAIGNASKHGVLIKGGKYVEFIGQIKAIALDKTRTLTLGRPMVCDIIPYGKNTREDLLQCAAGIEIFSEHPLGQSIVEAAQRENLPVHLVENYKSLMGKGAQADCLVCTDKHHCLGKLTFILEEHRVPQFVIDEVEGLQREGKTPVVIATHREVEGVIALNDEIRPDSFPLIQALQKLGIVPIMLTGDHFYSAQWVATQLNIKEINAELLPEDKAHFIEQMIEKYGTIAMVGDGINDAPALARANIGIAMGSLGSDTAIEAASIVILNNRLDVIPFLVQLGKKTLGTIHFNIALAITVKLLVIILALVGVANLAMAIFADVGITLIVILVSLRLLKSPSVKL